jgi:hypothetical protein
MAPVGEAAGPSADVAAGLPDESAGGAGAKKGSYVPPAMRAGAAGAGERMGGSKYGERDDLATLRVTNVSIFTRGKYVDMILTRNLGLRVGRGRRAPRYVRALRPRHKSVLGQGQGDGNGKGFRVHQLRGSGRCCQGSRQDGRFWFQALDSESRIREEGDINGSGLAVGMFTALNLYGNLGSREHAEKRHGVKETFHDEQIVCGIMWYE